MSSISSPRLHLCLFTLFYKLGSRKDIDAYASGSCHTAALKGLYWWWEGVFFLCTYTSFYRSLSLAERLYSWIITVRFSERRYRERQRLGYIKECKDSAGEKGCDWGGVSFLASVSSLRHQQQVRPYARSDLPANSVGWSFLFCFQEVETVNSHEVRNPNKLMRRRK